MNRLASTFCLCFKLIHMNADRDAAIAVYSPQFLQSSMTFIYRQLLGIANNYQAIVLTSKLENQYLFPFKDVYCSRKPLVSRMLEQLRKKWLGDYCWVTSSQLGYWSNAIKKHNVQLIHAHFGHSGIALLPLAKKLSLPLVVTFHGVDASTYLQSPRYTKKLKELFDYAYVITVSEKMRQELCALGANEEKTFTHYIGIPVDDFQKVDRKPIQKKLADNETIFFLQVSRFEEKKGHIYTVEAFAKLLEVYPNCQLLLGGAGSLVPDIKKRCFALGISDKVEFLGSVAHTDVQALMHKADVYLHHSVTASDGNQEGIPISIMEAMATGLVAVSTYHSGIPELLTNKVSGFIVHERDVNEYAARLEDLMSCESQKLSAAAIEMVHAKFNMRKQNILLEKIYEGIINDRS